MNIGDSTFTSIRGLAERYETPLPQQANRVAELKQKVSDHLERMGFKL